MRTRGDQVDDEAADEHTVAESEALAEERDVQHRSTVGIDTDPTAATALNGRWICAIEKRRELRSLVCDEQLLDPGRMVEGIRADYVYARHDRASPDGAKECTTPLATLEMSKKHASDQAHSREAHALTAAGVRSEQIQS
jgi:hypothetical protein